MKRTGRSGVFGWMAAGLAVPLGIGLLLAGGGQAGARAGGGSSSKAVRLDYPALAALGQEAFAGTYGTSTTGAGGGTDPVDFSADPDGVKPYATIVSPAGSTSGEPSVGAWDAFSDPNVLTVRMVPGGPEVLTIPTLHTYARCQPPHQPQTQNFVTAPTFLGTAISAGTTRIPASARDLGYTDLGEGTVTVTMTQVQDVTPVTAAQSRVVIELTGAFPGFSGRLGTIVLGDVRVDCDVAPTPPPSPPAPDPGELEVRKKVGKKIRHLTVRVGDEIRYVLVAENVGGTTLVDATFTDDLTRILRHTTYDGNEKSTRGDVVWDRPELTWTGTLRPGQRARITFSVTAVSPGVVKNVVIWPNPPAPTPTPTPTPPRPTPPRPTPPKPRPSVTKSHAVKVRIVPGHVK